MPGVTRAAVRARRHAMCAAPPVALAPSLSCLAITTCMYHIGGWVPLLGVPGPSREAIAGTSEGTDQDVRAFWCGNVRSVAYPPRAYFLSGVLVISQAQARLPSSGRCEGLPSWHLSSTASARIRTLTNAGFPPCFFLSYACVLYSSSPLMGTWNSLPEYDFTAPSTSKRMVPVMSELLVGYFAARFLCYHACQALLYSPYFFFPLASPPPTQHMQSPSLLALAE